MKTRSVSVRLPEDLIEFVNQRHGENFSDKLVRLLRNMSDPNSQYFQDIVFLEHHVHSLFRSSQFIRDLVNGSYDILSSYYFYGFVEDGARQFLQHLIDGIPCTEKESVPPFSSYGPPVSPAPLTAPAGEEDPAICPAPP